MGTSIRLVDAAAGLLDRGGSGAVTLRAVAQAVGVSHNAPYRHFKDRNALLAGVAERDFKMLGDMFDTTRASTPDPLDCVKKALEAVVRYGRDNPARYRLLFSDPDIGAAGGALERAALDAFAAFAAIISQCQDAGVLPIGPTPSLAGLIYATTHGLIDLEAGGRMREQKGLSTAEQGIVLLLDVLARSQNL